MKTIDMRGKSGDVHYECESCHWSVTLTPEGDALWTKNYTIVPRCLKCERELTRRMTP